MYLEHGTIFKNTKCLSLLLFWCFGLGSWAIMESMGTCPNQGSCQFVTLPSLKRQVQGGGGAPEEEWGDPS